MLLHRAERTANRNRRQRTVAADPGKIEVGHQGDSVAVREGYLLVIELVALREGFVPVLGQLHGGSFCRGLREGGLGARTGNRRGQRAMPNDVAPAQCSAGGGRVLHKSLLFQDAATPAVRCAPRSGTGRNLREARVAISADEISSAALARKVA